VEVAPDRVFVFVSEDAHLLDTGISRADLVAATQHACTSAVHKNLYDLHTIASKVTHTLALVHVPYPNPLF